MSDLAATNCGCGCDNGCDSNNVGLFGGNGCSLAAQLYGEFKEFFPNNAVEYFVS